MATITAIELGPDTCAFARTSGRRGEIRLLASEVLDPAAFPGAEAFTVAVRRTRRAFRLPRRCRVVVWGLPDGANLKDAAVKPLLKPLADAGFRVERVVTPCNALAALSRLKTSRGDGSTCWVAINRGGVAIVAVRPGKLIYAHSFVWDSTIGATGSQPRLLQRYVLVSHLSPHVKRAMAEARRVGSPVGVVVTCGNLPDLRSLTMPLIEELDVEVETLDSLEGLVVKPEAADKLAESASAIRLACAAVIARGSRPWDPSKKKSSRAAAYVAAAVVAALLAGLGYQWYARTRFEAPVAPTPPSQPGRPPLPAPAVSAPVTPPKSNPSAVSAPVAPPKSNPPAVSAPVAPPKSNPPAVSLPVAPPKSNPPAVSAPAAPPKSNPPAVSAPVAPPKSNPPAVSAPVAPPKSNPPAVSLPVTPPKSNPPAVSAPAAPPKSNPPAVSAPVAPPKSNPPAVSAPVAPPKSNPPVAAPAPAARSVRPPAAVAAPPARSPLTPLHPPRVPADKPEAGSAARSGVPSVSRRPMPAPLGDAIPRVTAILVSSNRRYATIDGGQIIGIGDLVGRRTVVGMDERSVLFREPSGVQIRIGLGGRLLAVERDVR